MFWQYCAMVFALFLIRYGLADEKEGSYLLFVVGGIILITILKVKIAEKPKLPEDE